MSREIPTTQTDLDKKYLQHLSHDDVTVGEEIWIPASRMHGDAFRAMRITIEERVSVGGFEEFNATKKWENTEGTTIIGPAESHQIAEGYKHTQPNP